MPPILHLVRHGEGFHNTAWHGEGICDPLLTPHGKSQCADVCKSFPYHDKLELLMGLENYAYALGSREQYRAYGYWI
ncbi:hypothetical protein VTO58DRAFT_104995 [Aureobasidium pullulans]